MSANSSLFLKTSREDEIRNSNNFGDHISSRYSGIRETKHDTGIEHQKKLFS